MKTPFLSTLVLVSSSCLVFATPSGLNNIPTSDTTPPGVYVFQTFTTLGYDRNADFNLGFKTGVFDADWVRMEAGGASHLLPDKGGPVTLHGKVTFALAESLPELAFGAANTTFDSDDRARAGDEFFYSVLTHDLGWFRIHGGCAAQDGEALPFFGLDKTLRVRTGEAAPVSAKGMMAEPVYRDLVTLRADGIRQRDDSWLYSAGVLVPVVDFFVFEAWGNFPDNGDEPSLTLKANFVLKF